MLWILLASNLVFHTVRSIAIECARQSLAEIVRIGLKEELTCQPRLDLLDSLHAAVYE